MKIMIKTPNPSYNGHKWGDYHYANSLMKAFCSMGHKCTVDNVENWYTNDDNGLDLVVVLRGLNMFLPKNAKRNVMWLISHPEKVSKNEIENFDHIFIASRKFTETLKQEVQTPVSCLYQATDIDKFNLNYNKDKKREIIFVGNSRNVYRKSVKDCIELGIPISVYGTMWEKFIDKKFIQMDYLDNKLVGQYYSSSKIVLNDHHDTMKKFGFINNRIFDAAACGSVIVSDYVDGMKEIFGDKVLTYKSKEDLARLYQRRENLVEEEELKKMALRIMKDFSFEKAASFIIRKAMQ